MAEKIIETPLMKQYLEMKRKHPDALLLFRVGDFYETFSQDAIDTSTILGITLTKRANGSAASVELAGFPHHALDTYLPKLIRAGRRVAICEQLEDPKLAKKLVKRGITELITPGVNTNESILKGNENNFLGGVHFGKENVGVAFLDISTGEFLCTQGSVQEIGKLLENIRPKEVLRMNGTRALYENRFRFRSPVFELEDWVYTRQAAEERLQKQFGTQTLKGFGVEKMGDAVIAAGSLLHYLDLTHHNRTSHITTLGRIDSSRYVRLDQFTMRNLELLEPMTPEGKTLLDVMDHTLTPMGARLLRNWIMFPLIDPKHINRRLDVAEYMFRDTELAISLEDLLKSVGDVERLGSKVARHSVSPRELWQLKESMAAMGAIRTLLAESQCDILRGAAEKMSTLEEPIAEIGRILYPDPPAKLDKGQAIAEGVDSELDSLRYLLHHSKEALQQMQQRETEATGITSLKIGFNNVFGYYIEVRNTHKDKVPSDWIRKQTLVSAERYITPELKDYEQKIIGAEERIRELEGRIFNALVEEIGKHYPHIHVNAHVVAEIDVLRDFAKIAREYRYVRPVVDDSLDLEIEEGRHPVIERQLPPGEPYISNTVRLDCDHRQIIMLTGPNMSGKSALLRQTALITLMAQIGSFVPAQSARIGIVDKVFTRVGASDNLSLGESTFMVEMTEAASILNNMSARSLILFDELGRGTSTYDGISIAWSIVEHIHENGRMRPKTLFATHYHELNEMEKTFKRIVNCNVSVEEINGKVVFLRKLRPGGSEHSFGIHVAKLAGLPPSIVNRAGQVLKQLESNTSSGKGDLAGMGANRDGYQLSLFQLDDPLLSQIRDKILCLDIDNLTPIQALTTLHDLKSILTGK